ncbi:MAG: MCE family protein [Muribaculaceae bacterium]|nr:MCE family protein [Muribaculaceae bacterium]
MKKIFSKELVIGLCVIVALAILFFGINYLKGINLFKPANFYYVNYDNIAGLDNAAPVTIDGYKVGQVREIEFNYDNPGKIKVTLALNENLKVPEDSYAVIEQGLLNGASIVIRLGKSRNMIPLGGEIKGDVAKGMMDAVTQDIMPQVNDILPSVNALLVNLNQTAGNLNALSSHPALAASIARLSTITANITDLTASLNQSLGSGVPALMHNTQDITAKLDSVAADLAVLSAELKSLPISDTMDDVKATTSNLRQMSEEINNPDGTLGLLLRDPQLYNQLNQVSADIDSLIVDIKKNPKRYISIKLL